MKSPVLLLLKQLRLVSVKSNSEVTVSHFGQYMLIMVFYQCTALKEITLPENVTHIYGGAFSYSGIESFTAPSSLKAFAFTTGVSKKGVFELTK